MKVLDHPYSELTGGEWLKGNLHTHTTNSDGELGVEEVIKRYAELGYGFLMISDHDKVTTREDYEAFDVYGMVMVPGNEITGNEEHMLHVNADCLVAASPLRQDVIDDVKAAGGFVIVNHPNWQKKFDHCSIENLMEWQGYAGIEIFNGTIGRIEGSPYATNKWDMLLGSGRRVLGFANDDNHLAEDDMNLGWNVAYVKDKTVEGVVGALEAGRFYCSTGVVISVIEVEGMRIRIESKDAQRIVGLSRYGRRFGQVDGGVIDIEAPSDAGYARFELWGEGEKRAWTQAMYVVER